MPHYIAYRTIDSGYAMIAEDDPALIDTAKDMLAKAVICLERGQHTAASLHASNAAKLLDRMENAPPAD